MTSVDNMKAMNGSEGPIGVGLWVHCRNTAHHVLYDDYHTVVLVQTSLRSHATARNPCTYKYGNLCNDIFKTKFHMTARLPLLMKE